MLHSSATHYSRMKLFCSEDLKLSKSLLNGYVSSIFVILTILMIIYKVISLKITCLQLRNAQKIRKNHFFLSNLTNMQYYRQPEFLNFSDRFVFSVMF